MFEIGWIENLWNLWANERDTKALEAKARCFDQEALMARASDASLVEYLGMTRRYLLADGRDLHAAAVEEARRRIESRSNQGESR